MGFLWGHEGFGGAFAWYWTHSGLEKGSFPAKQLNFSLFLKDCANTSYFVIVVVLALIQKDWHHLHVSFSATFCIRHFQGSES